MNLTLARKVQLLLVLAIAFVALVGTAGLVSSRYLGHLIDAYQAERVPSLEALADLATAVGRAAGAASAVENGSLEASVHRTALGVVASQVRVVEEAPKAFEARRHEGEATAAWSRLQAPLAAWRKDLDALTAAAGQRAAHADRFAEAAAMQSQVTEAVEKLRVDAQAVLEKDRVGKNLMGDKDADGKAFIAERVQIAREKGKGWQEYEFLNPATKAVEQKVACFEVVDGVIVTCGAYKP